MNSDKILVNRTTVNEIEFYVSNDGYYTGMSQSGLSRLCGVDESAVRKLINNIGSDLSRSEILKSLPSKEKWSAVEASNQAEVIPSEICAAVIEYYAYESKAQNETARYSFRKFSKLGIDGWIKEIIGFKKDELPQSTEIVNLLNKLINKVDRLEKESKEYRTMRGRTVTIFPALDGVLEDFATEDELVLPEDNPQNYTITEWIKKTKKGVQLDKSAKHKFALLVSETYKSIVGKDPIRENRYDKATKKQIINVCVYNYNEFPILQLAWNKAFNM